MLLVRNLTVRFGDIAAVSDFDFSVATGEIVCVLGPSGCGKSTLLRAIAGLEEPVTGSITWGGKDVSSVPVHLRGFGLMFQDYALFPHKSVEANVEFGLRMQSLDRSDIAQRVDAVLQQVGLDSYRKRSVNMLSGGQKQRVALARALAPSPRLLMFDEPLGSLDRSLRERLVLELREMLEQLRITALYVTHDQEEALALADRVMVMRGGHLEQLGTPHAIWEKPRTEFVARFLGFNNIIKPTQARAYGWPVPERVGEGYVVYRSDGFEVHPLGEFCGEVLSRTYRGDHFLVKLQVEPGLLLEIAVRWAPAPGVGDYLQLRIDPDAVFTVKM